jgi:Na+/proline symporter
MSENPAPSAASMWWRLNIRMRLEKARRAQQPLIWMGRVSYAAIAITIGLLVMQIPGLSQPAAVAGLMALGAVALPVTIALWGWSRSKV